MKRKNKKVQVENKTIHTYVETTWHFQFITASLSLQITKYSLHLELYTKYYELTNKSINTN